jgi:hypothetical protein
MAGLRASAVMLLVAASATAAAAGPLVPPSDQPGRERYRFSPSPIDRFMQPQPLPEPLIRRGCDNRDGSQTRQQRARRDRDC